MSKPKRSRLDLVGGKGNGDPLKVGHAEDHKGLKLVPRDYGTEARGIRNTNTSGTPPKMDNMQVIQNVMAEMGLYEIRPPKTDELYTPSGVPYSPSGGNGYWKVDLPNRNRSPSERQDTSREPSDVRNSSRVVPQGQYVQASLRVAYRFLSR